MIILLGFSLCSMERPLARSALYEAVKTKNIPRIKELLALPQKKELLEFEAVAPLIGQTPLLKAVTLNNDTIVQLLAANGAHISSAKNSMKLVGFNWVESSAIAFAYRTKKIKLVHTMISATTQIKQLEFACGNIINELFRYTRGARPSVADTAAIFHSLLNRIDSFVLSTCFLTLLKRAVDDDFHCNRRYYKDIAPLFFKFQTRQRQGLLDCLKESNSYGSRLPLELRNMAFDYVYGSVEIQEKQYTDIMG